MEIRERTSRTFILALFGFIAQLQIISTEVAPPFQSFQFVREPSDVAVLSGRRTSLDCAIETDFRPTFIWLKNGYPINAGSSYTMGTDGTLTIQSVTQSTTGVYRCQVFSSGNAFTVQSREAAVTLASLRLEQSYPLDVTNVYEGDTARFECRAQGTGPFTYEWLRDRQTLDLTEERIAARYRLLPSGTLEIVGLRLSDEGFYSCRASSSLGLQDHSRQAQLSLRRGQASSSRVFEFTQQLASNLEYRVGTPVVLEVATVQPATFRWFKGDKEILPDGTHYSLVGQGSLYIASLAEIDTALYRVEATSLSDQTTIQSSVRVLALVPPSYTEPATNTYGREGQSVVLPCVTYGIPSPEMVWLKDGDPITLGEVFEIVPEEGLLITNALVSDSGFYQCVASNEVGNVQSMMELVIVGQGVRIPTTRPPTPPTEPPPPTTTTTTTPILIPVIIDEPIDPATGPLSSAPRQSAVSRTTSRTTYLTWQRPAVPNGEIQKYRILLQAEGSDIRPRIIFVRGNVNAKTIRDLLPDTLYNVQILAINDNGPGEMTDPVTFRTEEAVDVPEEPQNIDAMVQSSTSVLVTWEEPIDTFGDIEGCRLYYAVQNGLTSREVEIPVFGTSHVVQGLDPYTAYGFRILAINANGAGESTDVREVTTFSAKPGSPPVNLFAESKSNSSITLTWDPPTSDLNGVITDYRIKYQLIGDKDSRAEIKVTSPLTSHTIFDLIGNTGYEFKIAALTVNGTGPFTEEWIQEFTREIPKDESRTPREPAFLEVKGFPDRIVVRWLPPNDPYTMVRGYLLEYGKWIVGQGSERVGAWTRSFTIRNVEPKSLYVVKLRAFNKAGEGGERFETAITWQENGADPTAPSQVQALTESDSSIRLRWVDGNSPKDGNIYVISYKMDDESVMFKQVNTTSRQYLFTGLDPFSSYVFTVHIVRGTYMSELSTKARNTTFEAVPATAPTGLVVRGFENSSSLLLNWIAPSRANGIITGYVVYYTNGDRTTSIADWTKVNLVGNNTGTTLVDLDENSDYHVRVQAVNGAGLSPVSDIATGTSGAAVIPPLPSTGIGGTGGDSSPQGAGVAGFPWWMWLIALALFFLILLLLLLLLLCALCGCFKCCASLCPCCGEVCGAGGCFGQCWAGIARCWASTCPCCCSDEEECSAFCSKLCCGACICGGAEGRSAVGKNGAATAISAGSYKSNGPDVLMSSNVEETDALINDNRQAHTEFGGSGKVEAEQPRAKTTRSSPNNRVHYTLRANGGMTIARHGSVYETDNGRIHMSGGQHWIRDGRQHYPHAPDMASYDYSVGKSASHTYSEVTNREDHTGSGEGTGQSITYNTTNLHVAGGEQDGMSGHHSDVGRRAGAITPVTSVSTQMVNYAPSVEGGVDPFTITFEETTTTHSIEKSVPLLDGTNYKTISNHETHSKSYSTSDASKDRNLQTMLQNGLDSGPLAIDVPSTRMEPLSAITAPVYSRSTLDRGGGTSSLDSYSSSSHNQLSSESNLQTASKATSNLHTYGGEAASSSHDHNLNLQSSRATTNLNTYQGDLATDSGHAYHVELPNTLPRPGSNFHTSFEEHSESRMQDYGTGTGQGRVNLASRHMAATDGQVIRDEESRESFPYGMSDNNMMGMDELTMSQLGTGMITSSQRQDTGLLAGSLPPSLDYLPIENNGHGQYHSSTTGGQSGQYQSSSNEQSRQYQSSQRRMEAASTDNLYGMDSLRGHRSAMTDSQYGTGGSDMINTGSGYRYKSNVSLDGVTMGGGGSNMASSSQQRVGDFHTIDRTEGIDRLENLRRLTNKVLSASSSRLPTQNGGTGLSSLSTDHLDSAGAGHSDAYESGFSQRKVYRARSGSSGYQSTGNLANGGNQYSFNNNNSKINLTEPPALEGDSDWGQSLQRTQSYSQSRDGLVKVSPSPNAHHYLPPPPNDFGRGTLERSQSISNHIGQDQTQRSRPSSKQSAVDSEAHRRLKRSFSLDRLSPQTGPMNNAPPPVYQYHSSGSSDNPRCIYSSGYHSDTTLSSGGHEDPGAAGRVGVNPNLSSFTVPGPPPHYQSGPSRVRISAPTYSPLKRTNQPTATVKVRAQPLGGPRDGRISPESATRTFSTEDLNAEMQHLEGLMKDLNAITASELEDEDEE